jgi:hypothetical protein
MRKAIAALHSSFNPYWNAGQTEISYEGRIVHWSDVAKQLREQLGAARLLPDSQAPVPSER